MGDTLLYFLGVLAFNITASIVAFVAAYYSHRKRRAISWVRAVVALLAGWVVGSAIVFLVHLLLVLFGINVENTDTLETAIAFIVLLPVMFLLFKVSGRVVPSGGHDEPSAT